MTVTIPKQRNTNDRYMEQSKINSDHPTSNPTQQAVNSSSSTQPINSTVLQTTQSKKLSVNFLLNSPEEEHEDRLSLQPVHLPTTTLQSDKFTFVTSTNRTNLQSNSFHNLHEHSQNTPSPYSSNDSPLKRAHLEDGSNLPSKRPKSDPDNFIKQSSLSSHSFPTPISLISQSVSPVQPATTSYDPSLLYYNPITSATQFDLSNLKSKSLPLQTPSHNNTASFQDLLLAATTIEAAPVVLSPQMPSPPMSEASPNRRTIKYAPAPKNTPGPPNGAYFDEQWMMRYHQLKKFKTQYGHTNVTRTKQEWRSLGNWVCEQRRKVRAGKLTEQQFQLLDGLGFEWDRSYYFRPGTDSEIVDGEVADITNLQQEQVNNNNVDSDSPNGHNQ